MVEARSLMRATGEISYWMSLAYQMFWEIFFLDRIGLKVSHCNCFTAVQAGTSIKYEQLHQIRRMSLPHPLMIFKSKSSSQNFSLCVQQAEPFLLIELQDKSFVNHTCFSKKHKATATDDIFVLMAAPKTYNWKWVVVKRWDKYFAVQLLAKQWRTYIIPAWLRTLCFYLPQAFSCLLLMTSEIQGRNLRKTEKCGCFTTFS